MSDVIGGMVLTIQERHELGMTDGIVRLSVGIEDVNDLIEELDQGLRAC